MYRAVTSKLGRMSLACGLALVILAVVGSFGPVALNAQAPSPLQHLPPGTPRAWADAGAANQLRIINQDGKVPLRYRVRKTDAKGTSTREVIESREGNVARLIERNGAPLTAEENSAERERLQDILQSPDRFLTHQERDRNAVGYALELVRALPEAMVWTFAPGQPQTPNARGLQVVLDFTPNPSFKPRTLITEGLTGIAGRVWIDAQTKCVTRIQGRILHAVDFGWGGFLARINEGGTIEFEQSEAGDQRWVYSHLSEHLTLREIMVHTVRENTVMDASNVQRLPGPISYRDAINALLAMQIPTR